MSASIRMAAPPKPTSPSWPWHPCAKCWGQKVIYRRTGVITDGESGARQVLYLGEPCEACMGIGEVPESFSV